MEELMHTTEHTMTQAMQKCIDECLSCYSICERTAQHCLELGGKHAAPGHIRTLLDCAEICRTSAEFMLRGSQFHRQTCAVCAEVCRACEESCRGMGGDKTMKECADACRRCAESCERMASAA
jgi:hypothetical protein